MVIEVYTSMSQYLQKRINNHKYNIKNKIDCTVLSRQNPRTPFRNLRGIKEMMEIKETLLSQLQIEPSFIHKWKSTT